jgi:hypothetical protein
MANSAKSAGRDAVNKATATAKNAANKAVNDVKNKVESKVAEGKQKVNEAKQKVDNLKSMGKNLGNLAKGLAVSGMAAVANNFMNKMMGKLSQVPAMGVVSQIASMGVAVAGVSALVEVIKAATKKKNNPHNAKEAQNEEIQAGQSATSNQTGSGESGMDTNNMNANPNNPIDSKMLASKTADVNGGGAVFKNSSAVNKPEDVELSAKKKTKFQSQKLNLNSGNDIRGMGVAPSNAKNSVQARRLAEQAAKSMAYQEAEERGMRVIGTPTTTWDEATRTATVSYNKAMTIKNLDF